MQKIAPFLWFDGKAEEAMNFYTSIFNDSKVGTVMRYGEAGPGPRCMTNADRAREDSLACDDMP